MLSQRAVAARLRVSRPLTCKPSFIIPLVRSTYSVLLAVNIISRSRQSQAYLTILLFSAEPVSRGGQREAASPAWPTELSNSNRKNRNFGHGYVCSARGTPPKEWELARYVRYYVSYSYQLSFLSTTPYLPLSLFEYSYLSPSPSLSLPPPPPLFSFLFSRCRPQADLEGREGRWRPNACVVGQDSFGSGCCFWLRCRATLRQWS